MFAWIARMWNRIAALFHSKPQVESYRPSNLHARHR